MAELLEQLGAEIELGDGHRGRRAVTQLHVPTITDTTAPYDLVRKMRASVLVLGPLLAREAQGEGVAARRLRHRHAARSTCT